MAERREIKKKLNDLKGREANLLAVLGTLGDLNRFRIFRLLMTHPDLCVTEVAQHLNITVPAASQHFRILEMSGLVHKERSGIRVCYVLEKSNPLIRSVARLFKQN